MPRAWAGVACGVEVWLQPQPCVPGMGARGHRQAGVPPPFLPHPWSRKGIWKSPSLAMGETVHSGTGMFSRKRKTQAESHPGN